MTFKELFPDNFEERLSLVKNYDENKLFPYKKVSDLFSDGSILICEIDGHAKGQGCIFMSDKNLFIAADVCWGIEYLPLTDKIKWLPRKIQDNFEDYKRGTDLLKEIIKDGISVVVSHDKRETIENILKN